VCSSDLSIPGAVGVIFDPVTGRFTILFEAPKHDGYLVDGDRSGGDAPYAGRESRLYRVKDDEVKRDLMLTKKHPPSSEEILEAARRALN
jgi:hypothetical protein